MAVLDYKERLIKDFVEQFKGMPNIEALCEVVANQLQAVYDFYEELRNRRSITSSEGKQLDGIGNIVDLSRKEAGLLAGAPIPFPVLSDDIYKQYLIFKILKNTTDCTYGDIIKGFRMFWDKELYYREDENYPATMFFESEELSEEVDIMPLLRAPLLRAGGVGIFIDIPFGINQKWDISHDNTNKLVADFTHRYWRDGVTGVVYWDGSHETDGETFYHYFDGEYRWDSLRPNDNFKEDQVHTVEFGFGNNCEQDAEAKHLFDIYFQTEKTIQNNVTNDCQLSYTKNYAINNPQEHLTELTYYQEFIQSTNGNKGNNLLNGDWKLDGSHGLYGAGDVGMVTHIATIKIIKNGVEREELA